MGQHHGDDSHHIPHESEENEIAGPVVFALMILIIIIFIIYFLSA